MTIQERNQANGRSRTSAKMREIEAEFGEPFWDVVKGCAAMGLSRSVTADAIGYDRSAFFRLLRRYGQPVRWAAYKDLQVWQDREYPDDWADRIAAGRRASGERCRWVRVEGVVMLQRDYAVMMGISDTQARRDRLAGVIEEVKEAQPCS